MYTIFRITLLWINLIAIQCQADFTEDAEDQYSDVNDLDYQKSNGLSDSSDHKYHGDGENVEHIRDFPQRCNEHEVAAFCGNRCWMKVLKSRSFRELLNCENCVKTCFGLVFEDDCDTEIEGRLSSSLDKLRKLNQLRKYSGSMQHIEKKRKKKLPKKKKGNVRSITMQISKLEPKDDQKMKANETIIKIVIKKVGRKDKPKSVTEERNAQKNLVPETEKKHEITIIKKIPKRKNVTILGRIKHSNKTFKVKKQSKPCPTLKTVNHRRIIRRPIKKKNDTQDIVLKVTNETSESKLEKNENTGKSRKIEIILGNFNMTTTNEPTTANEPTTNEPTRKMTTKSDKCETNGTETTTAINLIIKKLNDSKKAVNETDE